VCSRAPSCALGTWAGVLALALCLPATVRSEGGVVRDGSIGSAPPGVVGPGPDGVGNATYLISEDLGEQKGSNLFHSFSRFDVGTGEVASFTGPDGVEHVISRVTGGSSSEIDGTIRSTIEGAELWLLNPAGILFGSGASLDLSGAFHASTADTLELSSGEVFSARLEGLPSIVRSAAPARFGFLGPSEASIEVQGALLSNQEGLELVAGNVEIGSSAGLEALTTSELPAAGVTLRGRVQISGGSSLIASTKTDIEQAVGGSIFIDAADVQVSDGVRLDTFATSQSPAGDITLRASSQVQISGSSLQSTSRKSDSEQPVGRSGSILIDAADVQVSDGASLDTFTTSQSPAGDITLRASGRVQISGGSTLSASTDSVSEQAVGGSILIDAAEVRVDGGAQLNSNTFGSAPGGHVLIHAQDSVEISGRGSAISTSTDSKGHAGSITLEAPRVRVVDGANVLSEAYSDGNAGDIVLVARDTVELTGPLARDGASISTRTTGPGAGGRIEIVTSSLILANGGTIRSGPILEDAGRGGDIVVSATESVVLSGPSDGTDASSAITASSAGGTPSSQAGDIRIEAPRIELRDGAHVSSRSSGAGSGGDIELVASEIVSLSGTAPGSSQGASILSDATSEGDAGTIRIEAPKVELEDGAAISTEAADGRVTESGEPEGSIRLEVAESLLLDGGSVVTASVVDGHGGNVTIGSPDTVVLREASSIRAEATGTGRGTGGAIDITADAVIQSLDSEISADAGETGTDGTVRINSPEVDLQGGLAPLVTEYLDAASLQRPSCAARRPGESAGRFAVATRRAPPTTEEGMELAFHAGGSTDAAAVAASLPAVGAARDAGILDAARGAFDDAERALMERRPAEAARGFERASERYTETEEPALRSDALRGLARAEQARGEYEASVGALRAALVDAEEARDPVRIRATLSRLGEAHLALGQEEEASAELTRGAETAEREGEYELAAALLDQAADHHVARAAYERASTLYRDAIRMARREGNATREVLLLSKSSRASLAAGRLDPAAETLQQAEERRPALPPTRDAIAVLIHLARTHQELAEAASDRHAEETLRAHAILRQALDQANTIGDVRGISFVLGNLGRLYRSAGHPDEALHLTRLALRAAEQADAPDSLYRWHHQAGRILAAEGRVGEAVASLRRAVEILDGLRQEVLSRYETLESDFRVHIGPVYRDLVDLLLRQHRSEQDPRIRLRLLEEARDRMEQLKAAELRNYFHDDCVAELSAGSRRVPEVARDVAIVYPILLSDRTELLVTLPSGLERFAAPEAATREVVAERARRFREALERGLEFRDVARELYAWLVRPYAEHLANEGVTTLVFVPDDLLRAIPMAALLDGETFLIERYATVVTPGLELIDPKPLDRASLAALLGGISQPPGEPPLENVREEIATIHRLLGGKVLLDDEFNLRRIEDEMRTSRPTLVHLASHGRFTGDPATSYVLTAHGERLTMDRLGEYVGYARFRDEPVELLVLSACETAAGDDRAALGLAGVAVRAGARSVIGSLWKIRDDVARDLVTRFYTGIKEDPSLTKAQALRRAQLAVSKEHPHPKNWAPFLLINNWL